MNASRKVMVVIIFSGCFIRALAEVPRVDDKLSAVLNTGIFCNCKITKNHELQGFENFPDGLNFTAAN